MDKACYTVGWIAPLSLELVAARSALEQEYGDVHACGYRFYGGKIGTYNVVLGVQPTMGTDAASDLAAKMQVAFPNIKFFLVVGIGGGVPRYGGAGAGSEVVLGDVVVSFPVGNSGGVVRYDSGAWVGEHEGRLNFVGHTNGPPHTLLGAVNALRTDHATGTGTQIPIILERMRLRIHENERHRFKDPGPDQDRLFQDNFSHPATSQGVDCQQCCNLDFLQQRKGRGNSAVRQTDTPKIHYGNIGSSNQLQISPAERNRLQKEHDVICFEMEGAGAIQRHPCLIVRGICDYSDSHKNKIWQPYAAATAAAYARELLESMPTTSSAEDLSASEGKKEIRELLRDLRITDPHDDKRRIEDTRGGLLKDSYRWILYHSDFRQWRYTQQSRLLWIKGDPGKGKTMLLCGIVNELKTSIAKTDLLSYFFCQTTDSRINNATAVLRGLLYSLIDQQPSLISHIRKKHDHAGKALFEDANTWVALSEIFTNILHDPSLNSAYLVVDALDECLTDLPKLLDFIVQKSPISRVKWIVSSRNWPDIEERLEQAGHKVRLCLELNSESISAAVVKFIEYKVLQLAHKKNYDRNTQIAVFDHLSSNANDTFLWVALVCQNLENTPRRKTLAKLNAFPPGLDSLYERMIQQIYNSDDADDADLCKRILATIAIVYRPITLEELTTLTEVPEHMADDLESLREIISLCGSFLTIRQDTIHFVHQSAKDFLFTKASNEIFPSGTEKAHYIAFSRSLQVMSKTLRRDMYNLRALGYPAKQIKQPDPDPLAASRYSCIYWVNHLCDCNPNSSANYTLDLRDGGSTNSFIRNKFLFWLEALSICKSVPQGVDSMMRLETVVQGRVDTPALIELVRDACRFIMSHKLAIEESPLQVYASALVFSPARSLIRCLFKKEEPNWITIKPAMEDKWGACLQTLEGHSSFVSSVAFSHNSARLASASWDDTVKIWDASSGNCLQTLKGHSSSVSSVAFSHDSARLASASDDNTVKIWDTNSGDCLQTLKGHSNSVRLVAFSHNSARLASASDDNTVKIWDASSGDCLQTLKGHSDSVNSVAFSHDSARLASASWDDTVKIWDANSGDRLQTLKGHIYSVNSVAFSHDSARLASASNDETVKIWDANSGDCLQTLNGHSYSVKSVAFSHNSARLASASEDDTVKIWDASSGDCLQTLKGHNSWANSVAFSHNSARLASASNDNTVKIWDASSGDCLQTLKGHSRSVSSVAFSHNSARLASASWDDTVKIWDASSGNCLQTLKGHSSSVSSVAFSHDSARLASASDDNTVKIWDPNSGDCLQTLKGHSSSVSSVAFSHNSARLASASNDNTVKIWDASSGDCLQTLKGHSRCVNSVAFSHDSARLASASLDNTVKIWDANSGDCLQTLKGHSNSVRLVAFSHDSARLASASYDNTVKIWDASSGDCLQTLEVGKPLYRISFDISDSYLHTEIGIIDISAQSGSNTLPTVSESHNPKYQSLALSSDRVWITYYSENLVWLPSEYRPACSAVSEKMIGIGVWTGGVWICEVQPDTS